MTHNVPRIVCVLLLLVMMRATRAPPQFSPIYKTTREIRQQSLSEQSLWMRRHIAPSGSVVRRQAWAKAVTMGTGSAAPIRARAGSGITRPAPTGNAAGKRSDLAKKTVIIRLTDQVYAAVGASALFLGGISELVSDSLSLVDLHAVALLNVRAEGGIRYTSTITMDLRLHQLLKTVARRRRCSMNSLVNSAINERLKALIASGLPDQIREVLKLTATPRIEDDPSSKSPHGVRTAS